MATLDSLTARRTIPHDARVSMVAAPDGWPLRRFHRPGPGRGALLFLGGRADTFEKYLESFDEWHRGGWSVSAVDWRGQGGSGRLCIDPHVGHCDAFAPWVDDLAHVVAAWSREQDGPHVIVAHSMGGFLTLRALLDGVIRADAVVLVAPMLGLRSPIGAWAGGVAAKWMRRLGNPRRPAWKTSERPGLTPRQRLLTADADRYADEEYWLEAQPDLRLGPPSWAWLAQAFAETARLRADPALASITTPILLLSADADRLVDPRAIASVAARLPNAELVRFGKGAAHELLREADAVRTPVLATIDDFLARRAA